MASPAVEEDPKRLLELVEEINRILDQQENQRKSPTGVKNQ